MTRYAAFLRGVNVGGVTVRMADVVRSLTAAGFGDVRTVLASGNVVLEAPGGPESVRADVEDILRREFGYDAAWVLVYDCSTLRSIATSYPFPPEVDGQHSYVTFVSDPAVLEELAALAAGASPTEKIVRGAGVLYWQVPKSATLDSTIGATMGRRRYRSSTTTRNLRTVHKVLGLADRP